MSTDLRRASLRRGLRRINTRFHRELWERRRENWTVEVSAAAWNRTLLEIATDAAVRSHVLVATESESAEMIVGLVMGTVNGSGEGEVDALYVAPEHQCRGVGRRLLSASFERLRAAGVENARVVVLAANAPARQFYEHMGGSEAGSVELDEDDELLPATAYLWRLHR